MRFLQLSFLMVLAAACLHAELEPLPHHPSQAGYHHATLSLGEYCLENKLYSEARTLCEKITGGEQARAREIIAECENKVDEYTAESWGGYLDRFEVVNKRRAIGLEQAGQQPDQILQLDPDHEGAHTTKGHKWLDGMGWLTKASHDKYSKLVLNLADKPKKPEQELSWDKPYVLVGDHFTLVTDLSWKRALKYAGLLQRFHEVFFEILGDFIPKREVPSVVWCCKKAETFVSFSKKLGFPMGETNGGLHVGTLQAVLINAERCDYVGRKNKSKDNLARTLYHECTHRLVELGLRGRRGGMASYALAMTKEHAWIVESIAIVFEDLQITKSKYKLKGLEDQRTWTIKKYWAGEKGKLPALKPVLAQGHQGFAGSTPINNVQKYALAGSVGWYCLFEKPDQFRTAYLTLLVDYYRTDTSRKDFKARFGVELKDFQGEWGKWVVKLK